MRNALLLVGLCCGELAILMLAFVWCMHPGIAGWIEAHDLYTPALFVSIAVSLVGCTWISHVIVDRYGD